MLCIMPTIAPHAILFATLVISGQIIPSVAFLALLSLSTQLLLEDVILRAKLVLLGKIA